MMSSLQTQPRRAAFERCWPCNWPLDAVSVPEVHEIRECSRCESVRVAPTRPSSQRLVVVIQRRPAAFDCGLSHLVDRRAATNTRRLTGVRTSASTRVSPSSYGQPTPSTFHVLKVGTVGSRSHRHGNEDPVDTPHRLRPSAASSLSRADSRRIAFSPVGAVSRASREPVWRPQPVALSCHPDSSAASPHPPTQHRCRYREYS